MNDKYPMGGALYGEQAQKVASINDAVLKQQMETCSRQSLRESIASRIVNAEARISEGMKYRELADLLDKHPDVMRILELVRDLGCL